MTSLFRIKDKLFYGWVVVAAFFAIGTIMYGSQSSFGVFFKSIGGEFGLTRAATSAIFSAQNVFGSAIAILCGWAIDRYGPRIIAFLIGLFAGLSLLLTSQTNALWQLFITYSLLFAVIGAVYTMIMSTVSRWFDKNRGLALGIAGSGIGLGMVAIAPFATYLISSFGWRMAYIIMGLIAWLIIIPLSRLLRKNPYEIGAEPYGTKSGSGERGIAQPKNEGSAQLTEFSLLGASRTRSFWLFASIWLLNAFCYFLVIIHIVPHATDIGIPAMEAATVLSLIGASFVAGRLLMGRVSDSIGRKKAAITCALLAAIAMIWLIWSQDLLMLYIFGVVFGFSSGGLDTSMAALIGDTFGMRSIGMIMGALQVTWGLGMVIGPAIGGLVFDVSNSYFIAFLAGTIAMFAVALFIALSRRETS